MWSHRGHLVQPDGMWLLQLTAAVLEATCSGIEPAWPSLAQWPATVLTDPPSGMEPAWPGWIVHSSPLEC